MVGERGVEHVLSAKATDAKAAKPTRNLTMVGSCCCLVGRGRGRKGRKRYWLWFSRSREGLLDWKGKLFSPEVRVDEIEVGGFVSIERETEGE